MKIKVLRHNIKLPSFNGSFESAVIYSANKRGAWNMAPYLKLLMALITPVL